MATGSPFTSVSGGNWNDGGTWGNTSPGVKGTDWPGNAADVVNIGTTANQSHVVIYNVSETNQLGAITIGATSGSGASALSFLNSMTTLLSLGQVDILVQATGELRVGKSGAIIPYNYTASIAWNTTGDGNKGLNVAAAPMPTSNAPDGGTCILILVQDATGGRQATFTSQVNFGTLTNPVPLTAAANKRDLLGYLYVGALSKYLYLSLAQDY